MNVSPELREFAETPDRLTRLAPDVERVADERVCIVACTEQPPAAAENVEVRPVETLEEHLVAIEVMWEAFATPEERRERERPHLAASFAAAQTAGALRTFLARLDGRPVGVGRSIYADRGVFLIAGAVVPSARGRGVYRALVRARWDDAVNRGMPALVTEAMPDTSLPILLRLGFQEICVLRRLEDVR